MWTPRRAVARAARAAGGYVRRRARRTLALAVDPAARPAVLYLLALAVAAASVLLLLLGDGGDPSGLEFGLLLASFGVVLYMSLTQAGSAPRRGR